MLDSHESSGICVYIKVHYQRTVKYKAPVIMELRVRSPDNDFMRVNNVISK